MNGKTIKKIRKELNSKEKEMVNVVFDYFNTLSFWERLKFAHKIICKKL
ncbi:MAG: hypothetical protein J6S67_13830 [Methanobrevibacter sp.]|nr:hypothetical protein [Methanobrevibacter sp.]